MRNTIEYPVTTDEIIRALTELRDREVERIAATETIGDITPLILLDAIERLADEPIWWQVNRIDDHGNLFVVRDHLGRSGATGLYKLLTQRGHKQVYTFHKVMRSP